MSSKASTKKILVVDDDDAKRIAVVGALQLAGFQILEAENGEEGLTSAQKEKPDLILLDIQMPKMDGLGMLAELRKSAYGKEVPVLLLTAFADSDKVAAALRMGASDYLLKSNYNLDEVVDLVKKRLEIE